MGVADVAKPCTGSDDIPSAVCYKGKLGLPIPGVSETFTWKIEQFADGVGVIDVTAEGKQASYCEGIEISKSGQEITVTKRPDECDSGSETPDTRDIKYCSDQDTIAIAVSKGPA